MRLNRFRPVLLFLILSSLLITMSTPALAVVDGLDPERFLEGTSAQDIPPYYYPFGECSSEVGIQPTASPGSCPGLAEARTAMWNAASDTDKRRFMNVVAKEDYGLAAVEAYMNQVVGKYGKGNNGSLNSWLGGQCVAFMAGGATKCATAKPSLNSQDLKLIGLALGGSNVVKFAVGNATGGSTVGAGKVVCVWKQDSSKPELGYCRTDVDLSKGGGKLKCNSYAPSAGFGECWGLEGAEAWANKMAASCGGGTDTASVGSAIPLSDTINPPEVNLQCCAEMGIEPLTEPTTLESMKYDVVPKGWSLGENKEKRPIMLAYQLMTDFSLTKEQAAGILGNLIQETGVQLPPNMNEGGRTGAPFFKGGYGWAQWTGSRQKDFINWSVSNGYMASDKDSATDAANYAFLIHELRSSEKRALTALLKTKTPSEAAVSFQNLFERPGKPNTPNRIKYAETVYKSLVSGTGVKIDDGANTPIIVGDTVSQCEELMAGLMTGGVIFNDVVFPLGIRSQQEIKNRGIFKNGTTNRAGHPYIAFDILAAAGTRVVSMTEGVVQRVVNSKGRAMGGAVTIHVKEKNLHVFYTHMEPVSLKVGQKVTPGTALGKLLSVKNYPAINADHLHIDAGTGSFRGGCSRSNPGGAGCKNRVDIGPDLFKGYSVIPAFPPASTPLGVNRPV